MYTPDHLHLLPQESLAGHFPDKNFMVNMNKIQYLFLWVNMGHIFPKYKNGHFFPRKYFKLEISTVFINMFTKPGGYP